MRMNEKALILDTTYILPLYRIEVKKKTLNKLKDQFQELLQRTSFDNPILISSYSILEAKWKVLHEYKKGANNEILENAVKAQTALVHDRRIKIINWIDDVEIDTEAINLWVAGHNDLADCYIAATAKQKEAVLITEDKDLRTFLTETCGWKKEYILSWKTLQNELNRQ